MSNLIASGQILADSATTVASGGGIAGSGAALAALMGFGWLFHHVHKIHKTGSIGKADPRRWIIAALACGILLTVGTGGVSGMIHSGASSVSSVLG